MQFKEVWLAVQSCAVTTILLTLHENRTIQNKLTTRSLLCVLVMRNIHPVLQGGSRSETRKSGCVVYLGKVGEWSTWGKWGSGLPGESGGVVYLGKVGVWST